MKSRIKYDYDKTGDSLFIYTVDDHNYEVSLDLSNNIILDFDETQKPVSFEFLDASNLFKISKNDFKHIQSINIQIIITSKMIELNINLEVMIHNKTVPLDVNRVISNVSNIPNSCSQLIL